MRGFTLVEILIVVVIIGLIAAIAIPNMLTAMQRAKQKATMKEMQTIAHGVEIYDVDYSFYPQTNSYDTLRIIIRDLEYVKNPPRADHWGTPYVYQVDPTSTVYSVISYGKDKTTTTCPTGFKDFDCDLVLSNGLFVLAPAS